LAIGLVALDQITVILTGSLIDHQKGTGDATTAGVGERASGAVNYIAREGIRVLSQSCG